MNSFGGQTLRLLTLCLGIAFFAACATGAPRSVPPSGPDASVPPPPAGDASLPPSMDSMVPPMPDALVPDAGVPDTSVPDASVPDADPPGPCLGVDCSGMDGPCARGRCVDGACVAEALADGTSCGGMGCSTGTCMAGSCVGMVEMDCTPCMGGYCALGVCEAAVSSIAVDFESGLPPGWTFTGDAPWETSMASPHGGMSAGASGTITARQSSGLLASFGFTVATELRFWVRTDTEPTYDLLEVYVDGSALTSWSGSTSWTEYTLLLMPGARTVEWRYTKDGSVSAGADRVWLDDITLTPVSLMASTITTDFEGLASLPPEYMTSGDASWTVATGTAHAGMNSVVSGMISDSETSTLTRTVMVGASGSVSFWYRTSTEDRYDDLGFYIDGLLQDEWSGETEWTRAMYTLAPGMHTLEWRYTKDGSLSDGSDQVWVDDIVIMADATTPLGSLCSP